MNILPTIGQFRHHMPDICLDSTIGSKPNTQSVIGFVNDTLGGTYPSSKDEMQTANSIAPAAPIQCPNWLLELLLWLVLFERLLDRFGFSGVIELCSGSMSVDVVYLCRRESSILQ